MEPQGSSASTVLITIVIVVLLAVGVYFGFVKGREEAPEENTGGLEINFGGGNVFFNSKAGPGVNGNPIHVRGRNARGSRNGHRFIMFAQILNILIQQKSLTRAWRAGKKHIVPHFKNV